MTERKIALSIEEAADYTGIGRNINRITFILSHYHHRLHKKRSCNSF